MLLHRFVFCQRCTDEESRHLQSRGSILCPSCCFASLFFFAFPATPRLPQAFGSCRPPSLSGGGGLGEASGSGCGQVCFVFVVKKPLIPEHFHLPDPSLSAAGASSHQLTTFLVVPWPNKNKNEKKLAKKKHKKTFLPTPHPRTQPPPPPNLPD